jgi:DNA-binding NarL/FixJ family response regulator
MIQPINIGIAEDHLLVRQGLVSMLKKEEDINVLFSVSNGKELLDELKVSKPHIILLDIRMPEMDGRAAYAKIKVKFPDIKVIILSSHFNDAYISEFIIEGVAGFLPKNCDIEKVVDAIYAVHEQGHYFDSKISVSLVAKLRKHNKFPSAEKSLTERQIEIIRLLYDEKSPEEISKILFLSRRTVEWHKNKIFEKTQTKTIVGLIKYAISNSLINM